jgi:hypothetical protein
MEISYQLSVVSSQQRLRLEMTLTNDGKKKFLNLVIEKPAISKLME